MPVIDPQGLFDGDRLAACSDKAKVYWPFLYCASNGYARLEINTTQIRKKCFSGFLSPPQDLDIIEVLKEYANNFLVLVYEHEGKQWLQFDTSAKYLPKHKSKKDNESPAPNADELKEFTEGYINWKSAKSLNLQLFQKISENFGKIRKNVRGTGIGIGVGIGEGIGTGVGFGKPETEETIFEDEEDGQGEEMKAEKQIPMACQQILGVRAETYSDVINQIKALAIQTSNGQVLREFEEWAQENQGDEFRGKPLSAWLRSRDSVQAEAKVAAQDPVVTGLARELAYRSDNLVTFDNRQKLGLRGILGEGFTVEEIVAVFKVFVQNLDTSRPDEVRFAAKNFVEKAGDLAYVARRKKTEKAVEDAAVARQAEEMVKTAQKEREERLATLQRDQEAIEDELPD